LTDLLLKFRKPHPKDLRLLFKVGVLALQALDVNALWAAEELLDILERIFGILWLFVEGNKNTREGVKDATVIQEFAERFPFVLHGF
jgi:hypothetical protein